MQQTLSPYHTDLRCAEYLITNADSLSKVLATMSRVGYSMTPSCVLINFFDEKYYLRHQDNTLLNKRGGGGGGDQETRKPFLVVLVKPACHIRLPEKVPLSN